MSNETKPISFDEMFPGRFLKAGLLRGMEVTLKISAVDLEKLPDDKGAEKSRGIISFAGREMQMVMNKTNASCIAAMFGKKVQDWVGHSITIAPETDKFGSETVDCIRVVGSPELKAPLGIAIKMPRRKPKQRTLRVTSTGAKPAASQPVDPDQDGRQ
jgi:hypothetical protein